MKKLYSIIIVAILLIATCVSPVSATTEMEQWQRQSGSCDLKIGKDGASINCAGGGLNFWKYIDNTVDLTDFSVTFTLEQEEYWTEGQGYYTITLTNNKEYGKSTGLFLLMMPIDESILRIEGQILNKGLLLNPSFVHFDVDTTKPITLRGKLVDDEHYCLTLDGDDFNKYQFEIPVNFPFHTDLNGKAYFTFGANAPEANPYHMTVLNVNNLEFTGSEESTGSVSGAESDDDVIVKPDGTVVSMSEINQKNKPVVIAMSTFFKVLICLCVLALIVICIIFLYLIIVKKRLHKLNGKN